MPALVELLQLKKTSKVDNKTAIKHHLEDRIEPMNHVRKMVDGIVLLMMYMYAMELQKRYN